jgi:hypothetical protein
MEHANILSASRTPFFLAIVIDYYATFMHAMHTIELHHLYPFQKRAE